MLHDTLPVTAAESSVKGILRNYMKQFHGFIERVGMALTRNA